MEAVNKIFQKQARSTKILQFGEGNFLRGFVDYMVDIANEKKVFDGGVAVVKPIEFGSLDRFNQQDCIYTVILRGKAEGRTVVENRIISSVNQAVDPYTQYDEYMALAALVELRFVVSNTTEAGITYDETDRPDLQPAKSYPGKLTQFLYERYRVFSGAADKGLIMLPVELIEHNGRKLLECVLKLAQLWNLPEGFSQWVREHNIFCDTLVDRIITGYPADEAEALQQSLGYSDQLIVTGEPFALWVIESDRPQEVREALPLDTAGLPVVFTDNLQPYRERKVRILNGAHTSTVLAAYLAGFDTVGQCLEDKRIRSFMEKAVYQEISPTVHLPAEEVRAFADSVFERFENPFIKHALLSISLNSVSKWKSRILPSLKDYLENTGKLPRCLTFSLAALMAFYSARERGAGGLVGTRGQEQYLIQDDAAVLDFFQSRCDDPIDEFVRQFLSQKTFWGEDLTAIPGFREAVSGCLLQIRGEGIEKAIESVIQ